MNVMTKIAGNAKIASDAILYFQYTIRNARTASAAKKEKLSYRWAEGKSLKS